jgi:periplasmic protein TonB
LALERGRRALRFSVDAGRELDRRAWDALSMPGSEAGGLLLGSANPSEIAIDRFLEIRHEMRQTPFVLHSERDRAELGHAIAAVPGSVAGFYRTHARGGDLLRMEDVELASLIGNVALIAIVETTRPRGSVCHAFTRGPDGAWSRAGDFHLPDLQPVVHALPPPDPQPAASEARRSSPASAGFRQWWLLPLVPVLVGLVTWLAFRSPRPATPAAPPAAVAQPDAGLELRLERTAAGDMKLQWNRQASAIRSAVGAWLRISEETRERALALDLDQLRSGNLLYAGAAGGDMSFRLEVTDGSGRSATESVRLIGGVGAPVARPPVQARLAPQQVPQSTSDRGVEVPADPATTQRAPIRPGRPLQLPAPETPHASAALPAPDEVAASVRLAPPPVTSNPVRPAALPEATRPAATPPEAVEPARAIRQFRPVVPPNMKSMLTQDTTVTVLVTVNDQGKVTAAEAQGTTGSIGQMLSGIAVDAARAWRFEPARRNGKPVASTVSLVFRFTK